MSLVAHYLMNDNAASTTVLDTTTNHNGVAARNTNSSGFTTAGKLGADASHQALTFNGTTDLITVTGDIVGTTNFSVSGWFYATGYGGSNLGRIFHNGVVVVNVANTPNFRFSVNNGSNHTDVTIALNTLYHFVVQYYNAMEFVYINGVLSGSGGIAYTGSAGNTIIGNQAAGTNGFAGWIDDLRFYSHILTPAEIVAIYNAGVGTELDAPSIVLPAAANVWTGSGAYGLTGSDITPTKVASSITNCSAGNIKSGVVIGDVTGTLSSGVIPVGMDGGF